MSQSPISRIVRGRRSSWWSELELTPIGDATRLRCDPEDPTTALGFLASCEPVVFEYTTAGGDAERLTFEAVAARLADIERARGASEKLQKEEQATARLEFGWQKIEDAYGAPDAETLVEGGRWAGFTRGDATAWCWNLFQFEPHGFVHPGSQVRAEALNRLEAGGLPEVFGYPERACEHVARGLTPRSYREHRIVLGASTYSRADVVFR